MNRNVRTLDPTAFARGTIAGSKRHLAQSAMLAAVVAALGALIGAPAIHLVGIGVIGAALVAYNLLRIRNAKRALQSAEGGRAFVRDQRQSHLVRGKLYLVASPLLVVAVAIGLAREQPSVPVGAWLAFVACAAFIAYGWVWWARALRRVRHWRAAEPSLQD